ncbi:hypothetical protein OH799_29380 [Nocardia sp. NBC_00881]|uniref:hypothetical protein n=1 Tax=Nocardia sp. NBC_00881 TaxID=2975995 RepID=UPI00386D18C0|nr:hypothetical protein OH799_29380 [Nocardia sp. NBC_00881]
MDQRTSGSSPERRYPEGCGVTRLALTRRMTGLEILAGRARGNSLGRSSTLIVERLGIPPIPFLDVTMPADADIDAALETDC